MKRAAPRLPHPLQLKAKDPVGIVPIFQIVAAYGFCLTAILDGLLRLEVLKSSIRQTHFGLVKRNKELASKTALHRPVPVGQEPLAAHCRCPLSTHSLGLFGLGLFGLDWAGNSGIFPHRGPVTSPHGSQRLPNIRFPILIAGKARNHRCLSPPCHQTCPASIPGD